MAIDYNGLVEQYIDLRDQRSALKKEYTASDRELVSKMDEIEDIMRMKLHDDGQTGAKFSTGTVALKTQRFVGVEDMDEFYEFILEQGLDGIAYLNKAANKSQALEYYDEEGDMPPGLKLTTKEAVSIIRPTGVKQ